MTAPIGGDPRARAAVPAGLAPVAPASATRPPDGAGSTLEAALARTGLGPDALLDLGADVLVARAQPSEAAIDEGLERARGALVRGAPHEMLAALDAAWAGARASPAGWYYRVAALALLGLPGEAERVLADALAAHRDAPALRFAQSVVHVLRGEVRGARDAHTELRRLAPPGDASAVLIRAWDAVLRERSGDAAGASAALAALMTEAAGSPEEPVAAWARRVVGRQRAEQARAALGTPVGTAAVPDVSPSGPPRLDAVDGLLRRLGARLDGGLVVGDMAAARREAALAEVLTALQALTTGGALWDAATPARVHAARVVLVAVLRVLASDGADAAPPAASADTPVASSSRVRPLAALIASLLDGQPANARALLPRVAATEGPDVTTIVARLLDGADAADDATPRGAGARAEGARAEVRGEVRGDARGLPSDTTAAVVDDPAGPRDDLVLAPLRFGLVFVPAVRRRPRVAPAREGATGDPVDRVTVSAPARWPHARELLARELLARAALLLLLVAGAWWLLLR